MSSGDQGTDRGVGDGELELVIVAAVDRQRVIGNDGELPWRLPADLQHFKRVTMGHPIIMGRKTHESIGTVLPGRKNIVLSRQSEADIEGCTVAKTLSDALDAAESESSDSAMIIGGQGVFAQTLPIADRMVLTLVAGVHDGNTFFPDFDGEQWEVGEREVHRADEDNDETMVFVELEPVAPSPRKVWPEAGRGELPDVLRRALEGAVGEYED